MMSNDPRLVGHPDTPPPVICEYCGAERYTEGINLLGTKIFWCPNGARPCQCSKGQAEYKRKQDEAKVEAARREKAEADKKMRDRVRRVIGESGMGERFLQRTFQAFKTETDAQRKIKAAAQAYAKRFDTLLPKRGEPLPGRNGLLLSGTKGVGKTHIAAAIANDLLHRGTAVICMTERNLFGKIQSTYQKSKGWDDGQTESQIRNVYETAPLLIIDDLGKEKASEWTLATLYAIVDGRYDRALPIIITTNYDAESLVARLTPKGSDPTTADAIVDRLLEMCKLIEMDGESWRSRL